MYVSDEFLSSQPLCGICCRLDHAARSVDIHRLVYIHGYLSVHQKRQFFCVTVFFGVPSRLSQNHTRSELPINAQCTVFKERYYLTSPNEGPSLQQATRQPQQQRQLRKKLKSAV